MPENTQQTQTPPESGQGQAPPAPTFDEWLAGQGDEVKSLLDGHTKGLRTALDSERTQRKEFERQLREATAKVDQGSEARKKLDELGVQLELQGRQAEFYETAHAAGVSNLRLAWVALQQDASLADRSGKVDWKRFQEQYPELFGGAKQKAPAGNAGAGTQNPPGKAGMNEFIRKAAGRS